MVSTIIFYKMSIIWFFSTFPPTPKSIINQTPSPGYQALHGINPAYLSMLSLLLTHSLSGILFPAHWILEHAVLFPTLTSFLTALLLDCFLSFRSVTLPVLLFVILPNLSKCQAHSRWPKNICWRKERTKEERKKGRKL